MTGIGRKRTSRSLIISVLQSDYLFRPISVRHSKTLADEAIFVVPGGELTQCAFPYNQGPRHVLECFLKDVIDVDPDVIAFNIHARCANASNLIDVIINPQVTQT